MSDSVHSTLMQQEHDKDPGSASHLKKLSRPSTDPAKLVNEDVYEPPRVLLKFFLHTLAMFTLPFVAYFSTNRVLRENFEFTKMQGFVYGAVAAVIAVHVVIGSYIYHAFAEEKSKRKLS